jgi:type IV pilus assembly protein PilM
MFGARKTVIGLDVGSYAVKAVALEPNRDRLTLVGCAQARLAGSEPGEVIRRVIDQLGVKPRQIVSSVSGRSVIVRQVETPRLPPDELKAHITYEADKYIPFGAEEVIIDCQPLAETAEEAKSATMQVLLVAVRRGFVEDHVSQLKAAGLHPEVVDVDVFALANAYELLGPVPQSQDPKSAIALIDIGASKSNIAIVQNGRLIFTREIYQAGNEITDAIVRTFNEAAEDIERIKADPGETVEALIDAAMPAFEDLANEIRLSFDYVEGQFEAQVSDVVLTGGSSQLTGITGILGNILGRPVHIFDPLAALDLVPSRYDIHTLDATSPSLTIALGLAAHLIPGAKPGMGGANSHGWQSRAQVVSPEAGRFAGTVPPPMMPTDQVPAVEDDVNDTMPVPSAPGAGTAPLPAVVPTAMAPSLHDPLPLDLGAFEPAPSSANIPAEQGEDELPYDPRQSGLLVVLEEEDAAKAASSEVTLKPLDDLTAPDSDLSTSGLHRSSASIKVEAFDEEDEKKDDDGLPPLPKL